MTIPIEPVGIAVDPAVGTAVKPVEQQAVAQTPSQPDPAETSRFSRYMAGGDLAYGVQSSSATSNATRSAATALAAKVGGGYRSFEDIRASMMRSLDPSNPMQTMFAMTSLSIEAQATFTRLHLSSSLASAATSLFGTLLRNQQ
jgi:hypothetical protein